MKIKVFVDGNYRVYSQEEVNADANEMLENADKDIIKDFMQDIDTMVNINPLFRALREGDSEAFLDLSKRFQEFLDSYKDTYISENFYESYIDV